MITHTEALVPGTREMEQKVGYTKFDMGAVLVRDGFVEYDRLCVCNEILLHMREISLDCVADRLLLQQIDRYWQKVQIVYHIMGHDLRLHKAITKCREVLRSEDDDFFQESEDLQQKQLPEEPNVPAKSSSHQGNEESEISSSSSSPPPPQEKIHKLKKKQSFVAMTPTAAAAAPVAAAAAATKRPSPAVVDGTHPAQSKPPTTMSRWGDSVDSKIVPQQPRRPPRPPANAQRFQRVEICGLEVPLRFIRMEDYADDAASVGGSSFNSDDNSWCWELELPEHAPPPPPATEERRTKQDDYVPTTPTTATTTTTPTTRDIDTKQSSTCAVARTSTTNKSSRSPSPPPSPRKNKGKGKISSAKNSCNRSTNLKMTWGKSNDNKQYGWAGKDFYAGDSASWRIGAEMKKANREKIYNAFANDD